MIKTNNKKTRGGLAHRSTTEGFTLVETLVAIGILVLAVTGAFSAAQMGITTSTYSKDQVVAFYLAQDGVEFIRNIRDDNGLTTGQTWLSGISSNSSDPCYFGNTCIVDPTAISSPKIIRCSGGSGSCPPLKQDSNGIYGYVSGTDTIFRREIQLKSINDHEISILVSVIWKKGLIDRTFRVRENIFNWQTST